MKHKNILHFLLILLLTSLTSCHIINGPDEENDGTESTSTSSSSSNQYSNVKVYISSASYTKSGNMNLIKYTVKCSGIKTADVKVLGVTSATAGVFSNKGGVTSYSYSNKITSKVSSVILQPYVTPKNHSKIKGTRKTVKLK